MNHHNLLNNYLSNFLLTKVIHNQVNIPNNQASTTFGYVGRLIKEKGVKDLLICFEQLLLLGTCLATPNFAQIRNIAFYTGLPVINVVGPRGQ